MPSYYFLLPELDGFIFFSDRDNVPYYAKPFRAFFIYVRKTQNIHDCFRAKSYEREFCHSF